MPTEQTKGEKGEFGPCVARPNESRAARKSWAGRWPTVKKASGAKKKAVHHNARSRGGWHGDERTWFTLPEARVVTTEWGHKVQKAGARRPSRVRAHNAKGVGTGWGYAMQKHAKRNAKHAGGPKDGRTHRQKHAGMVAQVRTENAENRGTVSKAGGYSVPNAGGTLETGNTMGAHRGIHGGGGSQWQRDGDTQC